MRRSTDKILTTHTGSLPRPAKVVDLLTAHMKSPSGDHAAFDAAVAEAVAGVVAKQKAAGIDVINDGEQGRADYTVHVIDRLAIASMGSRMSRAATACRSFRNSPNC